MRLVTFRHQGQQEIGALVDADLKIIRLQAAEQFRDGDANPHFQSMLAFLQGGSAARDEAQRVVEFAASQRPENVVIERSSVALEELAAALDMPAVPTRIECYDISHVSGTNVVAG